MSGSTQSDWIFLGSGSNPILFPLRAPNGSAAIPQYSWINSPTTGFYRAGADQVGLSIAGTNQMTLSAAAGPSPVLSFSDAFGGVLGIHQITCSFGLTLTDVNSITFQTNSLTTLTVSGSAGQQNVLLGAAGTHLCGGATNADFQGTITVTNPATSASHTFAIAYAIAPVAAITPIGDLGAGIRYWVTTSTTAVTVNLSAAAPTTTFNYIVIGNAN